MDAAYEIVRSLTGIGYGDLPADVIDVCKKDILDTLAVAFAGSSASGIPEITKLYDETGGKPESSIIASSARVPAMAAAFVNSSMAHALDFDDTHDEAVLHAGVCVIPPVLALAERKGAVSGEELIVAVACGIELMCRLGVSTRLAPPQTGWVYTSVYGAFGSALACARLLGLKEERITNALGIAYSCAAGNMQCIEDAALTKRMQAGFAGRTGVEAALLANAGVTGARNILDGKYNLFRVYHKDNYNRDRLLSNLGKDFELSNLSFKPYPCCRYTHPFIDAALALRNEDKVSPLEMESITIVISETESFLCEPLDVKSAPRTMVDAQFSIPWTVAVALSRGSVKIGDFTEDAVKSQEVSSLARKILVKKLEDVPDRGIAKGLVEITTNASAIHTRRVDTPKGHPLNPMDWHDLADKFGDCASWGRRKMDADTIGEVVGLIQNLENLDDISRIMVALAWQ